MELERETRQDSLKHAQSLDSHTPKRKKYTRSNQSPFLAKEMNK